MIQIIEREGKRKRRKNREKGRKRERERERERNRMNLYVRFSTGDRAYLRLGDVALSLSLSLTLSLTLSHSFSFSFSPHISLFTLDSNTFPLPPRPSPVSVCPHTGAAWWIIDPSKMSSDNAQAASPSVFTPQERGT